MSLTSTMFTGASGILNNAEGMSVIGNNISNVNTIGFKGSRMLFSDVLSTIIGNNSVGQIGHGVQIQKVDTLFGQSSNETTTSPTDLFIQGKRFFAVAAPGTLKGPIPATGALYTRAGSFRLDTTGLNLINPDNFAVLDSESMPIRFKKDSTSITTALGTDIFSDPPVTGATFDKMNAGGYTAVAGTAAVKGTAASNVVSINGVNYICIKDTTDPATTGIALDSPLVDTIHWARGSFDNATVAAMSTAAAPDLTGYSKGAVVFGSNGAKYVNITGECKPALDPLTNAPILNAGGNATYVNPVNDTTNWELVLEFQKVLSVSTKGEISLLYADAIGNSATLFYNGSDKTDNTQKQPVLTAPGAWVGLAEIPNPAGLIKEGASLYRESGVIIGGSGTPVIGAPNATTESIISSNLELSGVDLALEFVKMIQTQRAYSANSKTITTADEMMQEILNLKR